MYAYNSVDALRARIDEECSTVVSDPDGPAALLSPTSTWLLDPTLPGPARRLPPDPAATTLFQLRQTRLLQPLWLFVETEALAGGVRQCSAAPQQSEEDRLVFVRERVGEQHQWVGSVVLPATAGQTELQNKVQQLFPASAVLEWEQLPDGAGQDTAECGETGLVCLVRRILAPPTSSPVREVKQEEKDDTKEGADTKEEETEREGLRSYERDLAEWRGVAARRGSALPVVPLLATLEVLPQGHTSDHPPHRLSRQDKQGGWKIADTRAASRGRAASAIQRFLHDLARPTDQREQPGPSTRLRDGFSRPTGGGQAAGKMKVGA